MERHPETASVRREVHNLATTNSPLPVLRIPRADARIEFRDWLRRNRRTVANVALREVLRRYGGDISLQSAYRIAVVEGLRGHRRNASRYAAFWEALNWDLPDSVLSAVWNVTRGNLRQRRLRLGVGRPKYRVHRHSTSPTFLAVVACEKRIASRFTGLRPH
jgi:hypothetical protein